LTKKINLLPNKNLKHLGISKNKTTIFLKKTKKHPKIGAKAKIKAFNMQFFIFEFIIIYLHALI
jgi:hypothetical protein